MTHRKFLFTIILICFNISLLFSQNNITILHTNDLHTQFTPLQATWVKQTPKPLIGGMEALAAAINTHRDANTLLLDAGDVLTGTLLSRMEYEGVMGGAFISMMNVMKYDASVIGNHDFDNGRKSLEKLMALADFDILSANLFIADSLFAPAPYQIFERGDVTIGVIGLTISPILGLVPSTSLDSVRASFLAPIAQKWIDHLDPMTDLIILLTHQGATEDSVLATQIHSADVIVGGHSHTRLDRPKVVDDILIVQAGSKSRYLGKLDLIVAGDSISSYDGRLIPVWADSMQHNTPMSNLVHQFSNQIDSAFGDTIATLKHDLMHDRYRSDASSVGSLITTTLQSAHKADFAIMNTGGIRKSLFAGPVTKKDIYELLPFINYLVQFECTGVQLAKMIDKHETSRRSKNYESIQFSYFIISGL